MNLRDLCRIVEEGTAAAELGAPAMFAELHLLSGHLWTALVDGSRPEANYYRCLGELVQLLGPRRVLEVGTGFGLGFGTILYAGARRLERVDTVDLDHYIENGTIRASKNATAGFLAVSRSPWRREHAADVSLALHILNTQTPREDDPVAWRVFDNVVRDASVDLLIVDGAHEGEAAYRDLETFWPKVAPGGVVLVDDLHHEDDDEAFRVHPWCNQVWDSFESFEVDHEDEIEDRDVWFYPRVGPRPEDARPWGLLRKRAA